jgi:tRNA/rRNA methyltransferase
MRNEDVYRCHVALQIPTNPDFGSLNLASALQVIAYEWRLALGGFGGAPALPGSSVPVGADGQEVAGLLAHWEQALVALSYLDPNSPKKLMPRLNQLFNRAAVTQEEVNILRGIAKSMLLAAKAPDD